MRYLTVLLIADPFLPAGLTGRNNADDFCAVLVFTDNVRDQEQEVAGRPTERLPTSLSVFDAVLNRQGERVGKNQGGYLEAHAALCQIARRLPVIPFKAD
jgi:hypothetical protein